MADSAEIIQEDPNSHAALVIVAEGIIVVGTYLGSKAVAYELIKKETYDPFVAIQDACEAPPPPTTEGQITSLPNCSDEVTALVDSKADQGENTADTLSDTFALGPTFLIAALFIAGHVLLKGKRR